MKKTVFISSTYEDLAEERGVVWNLLEKFEVNVRGMEEFGARTSSPLETCLAEVDVSDIYIGILAFRLGSIEQNSGKSYTQLEYDRAYEGNKEILIYLIDEDNAKVLAKYFDRDERRDKLDAFKEILKERHTVATYRSPDDLSEKLERDFRKLLQSKTISTNIAADEFEKASATIKKFLLVPNETSGTEVRVKIKIIGEPYSASNEVCAALNLVFGSTIGLKIEITEPKGFSSCIDKLYLRARQMEDFFPIQDGDEREIYAKLQFTSAKIKKTRARFSPETRYESPYSTSIALTAVADSIFGRTVTILEPDGMIVLLLSDAIGK